ncbi:MAG: heavy metal translocating P-type ATPase [Actinomycetia bacterium]|nr:heavy metal translocating P-type ATPase [Actinomycetes bacterium]
MSTTQEFDIEGMTCASCAARIQKRVNRLPGVTATVNLATHSAAVELEPGTAPDDVINVISDLGYSASPAADLLAPSDPSEKPAAGDHSNHGGAVDDLRRRLFVAIPLAAIVAVIGMVPLLHSQTWLLWLSVALATPVVWWSGWPIHASAVKGLRHGSVGMDTLVSLGSSVAYFWSLVQIIIGDTEVYAEVAAVVITFILLGRWLEARATQATSGALEALSHLQVNEVTIIADDGTESVRPTSQLRVGQKFLVRPGERIATDGAVVDGHSDVDASLVTGESLPVDVDSGSEVIGGSINGTGRLVVAATSVGANTVLARIATLIKEAQQTRAPVERLVDRIASVFVPIVLVLALLTLAGWLIAGESADFAIGAAVAVLVIACPCALGLATPTALVAGTGRGAELGVLLRGPQVLEAAQSIDTVVLDKTGTVTTGQMTVDQVVGGSPEQRLQIAALESASEHPIGKAIAGELAGGAALPPVVDFAALAGVGAQAQVHGQTVHVGKVESTEGFPPELATAVDQAIQDGLTPVLAAISDEPVAVMVVGDHPKPSSAAAIARLKELGLTPVLLSGDRASTADAIASQVGIDQVLADVRPEGKVSEIQALQHEGHHVAMVGDGINDAAALATANLGIAMGSGTDAAREAADLTIVRDDLESVADAIALARRTWRTIKQNLFWAFGYNVAAIPLAMSGRLSPMIAGGAMALSSVLVVSNSLRLRRYKP